MNAKKRFLFDRMLGKAARKMRLLGYDATLNPEDENGRFLLNAAKEKRVAVTRSTRHSDRPGPSPLVLSSKETHQQIAELFDKLGEKPDLAPFTRCMECNSILESVSPDDVKGEIPCYVEENFDTFKRCPACGRVYWEGTHYQDMKREVEKIRRMLSG